MANQTLVAFTVASREHAHELFQVLLRQDEADDNVKIVDAVAAYKTDDNQLKIEQTTDATAGEGAFGGGVVVVVVGLIAGGPLGAVVGGLAGGAIASVYAAVRDSGINNKTIKSLAEQLQPGQAALVLLYSGELNDEMLESLKEFEANLIHDTLPEGSRDAIMVALAGAGIAAAAIAPTEQPIIVTLQEEVDHGESL
ncbi:MAG: DUF1269 domain-containing protein [Anaerolineae bacterium]|nr:DUF1269 domain-containing protein [Anaerolineae bacterium]